MKKRKSKKNFIWLILALFSPFAVFGICALYRRFSGGEVTLNMFLSDFKLLFSSLPSPSEFIFPTAFVFAIGLLGVIISIFVKKKISPLLKTLYFLFSLYAIQTGARILFVITRGSTVLGEAIEFVHSELTVYSLTFALFVSLLIFWILSFFNEAN